MSKKRFIFPFVAALLVGVLGTMEFSGFLFDDPWENVDGREVEEELREKSETNRKDVLFDFGLDHALPLSHSYAFYTQDSISHYLGINSHLPLITFRLYVLYCCLKISFC